MKHNFHFCFSFKRILALLFGFFCISPLYAKALEISDIQKQYNAGQYAATITLAQQYLAQYPNDSDVWILNGYAHYHLREYLEAHHDFETAVVLAPRDPDGWKGLIHIYYQQGNYQKAKEALLSARKLVPNDDDLNTLSVKIDAAMTHSAPHTSVNKQAPSTTLTSVKQPKMMSSETKQEKPSPIKPGMLGKTSHFSIDAVFIKKLLAINQLTLAEQYAKIYLNKYPSDPDVHFLLGKIYQKQSAWQQAYTQFALVLATYPRYPDAREAAIAVLFNLKEYSKIITLATEGMLEGEDPVPLSCDIARAQYASQDYQGAITTLTTIPDYENQVQAKALYDQINAATNYKYISYMKVGMNLGGIKVQNPNQVWTLSSVYAQYNTPKGNIGMAVNYQTRPSLDAPQYTVYVQPILSKTNYASLAYSYANDPNLFPNQTIYAEDFQLLPWNMDISLGNTYRKLPSVYFNAYTGSIGKYLGSYYIQLRPTYFVPDSGPRSLLYTLTIQKYFAAEEYIGLTVSEGTAPDLADFNTASVLKTDLQTYMFSGQHMINKQFAVKYGIGEAIENFGNNNIRYYTYLNGGLSFRDVQS